MLSDRLPDFLWFRHRTKRVHNEAVVAAANAKACPREELLAKCLKDDEDKEEEEEDPMKSSRCPVMERGISVVDERRLPSSSDLDGSRALSHEGRVSGLPFVCSNCGVSYFMLQQQQQDQGEGNDDDDDDDDDNDDACYCSGECKWSVILYREMDERMRLLRRPDVWWRQSGSPSWCSPTPTPTPTSWATNDDHDDDHDDDNQGDADDHGSTCVV